MKIQNKLLFVLCFLISSNSYSQITLGLNSGSDAIIGIRTGYKFNEKFEAGIKYSPAIKLLSCAGFSGAYVKYNFNEIKRGFNPYLIINFGQIAPPKNSSYEEIITKPPYIVTKYIDYKSIIGGSIGCGIEINNNKFRKLKYILELGIGRMPNTFKGALSTDPYSSAVINADTKEAFTALYYFTGGLVYNFDFR
jgi:hypothetical protein